MNADDLTAPDRPEDLNPPEPNDTLRQLITRIPIHASRRRAAGRAPARHSRRATPADYVRTIRRALAARRVDSFEELLARRSDERLAEIAGGSQ